MQFLSSTFLSDSPIMISRSHSCIASHIWDAFKNMQNRQNVHFLTKTFSNILYKYYKVLNFQICNNFEKSCSNGLNGRHRINTPNKSIWQGFDYWLKYLTAKFKSKPKSMSQDRENLSQLTQENFLATSDIVAGTLISSNLNLFLSLHFRTD